MKNENDGLLFVLVFLVCPALYLLVRSLPLLLFYIVPLFGSTFLIGLLWIGICHASDVNYRRVAWLMAGTILILVITIGFPQDVVYPAKGKVLLQSPWLYHAYNNLEESIESAINRSWLKYFRWILPALLPPREYVPVLYDLRDFAWCLWLGVCFGAPALFLHYSQRKDQERIRKIEETCLEKTAAAEREKADAIWELRRECLYRDDVIAERDEEIKKLKEVVAAIQSPIGPPPPPSPTSDDIGGGVPPQPAKGGVLDAL